ncbi:MAG TPA: hypothetical protein VFR97_03710 [Capillimicrobium sp.]|nr:hypothetical protein [Capillimicrobium sp.]
MRPPARRAAVAGIAAAALGAVPASASAVRCERHFHDVPGIPADPIPYRVVALRGAEPDRAALTCRRGRQVIQRGFDRFGLDALSYERFGDLAMRVAGTRYVLARPVPLASGSHAWRGGGTRVQYSLPTGR